MRVSLKSSLLLASALGLVLSNGKGALAQTAPDSSSAPSRSQSGLPVETVVVTGSVQKEEILHASYSVSVLDQEVLNTSPRVETFVLTAPPLDSA